MTLLSVSIHITALDIPEYAIATIEDGCAEVVKWSFNEVTRTISATLRALPCDLTPAELADALDEFPARASFPVELDLSNARDYTLFLLNGTGLGYDVEH